MCLVPCSHPHPFQPHADSRPCYRCSPVSVLIAYVSLWPVVLVSISSSSAELYFPSLIIISLVPIEHCSKDYLASILLTRLGLRHWDAPRKPPSLPPRPTSPLETVCVSLLDLVVALAKFLLVFIVKNGFSDLTKEQEGRDRPRKDVK